LAKEVCVAPKKFFAQYNKHFGKHSLCISSANCFQKQLQMALAVNVFHYLHRLTAL